MKDDFKKAGKNSQDCGSKCAGNAKGMNEPQKGAQSEKGPQHEAWKQQKPEHKK